MNINSILTNNESTLSGVFKACGCVALTSICGIFWEVRRETKPLREAKPILNDIEKITISIQESYPQHFHYFYARYIEPLIFKATCGSYGSNHLKDLVQKQQVLIKKINRLLAKRATFPLTSKLFGPTLFLLYALGVAVLVSNNAQNLGTKERAYSFSFPEKDYSFKRTYSYSETPKTNMKTPKKEPWHQSFLSFFPVINKPRNFNSLAPINRARHIQSGYDVLEKILNEKRRLHLGKMCSYLIFYKLLSPLLDGSAKESYLNSCNHLTDEFQSYLSNEQSFPVKKALSIIQENCPTTKTRWNKTISPGLCKTVFSY